MTTRPVFAAFASTLLPSLVLGASLVACDGGMTGPSFEHLTSLSLSRSFACGLDEQGGAYCWGSDNSVGQLGDGSNKPSASPVRVTTGAHACGLTTEGKTLCWGNNYDSQIGVTTTDLDCQLLQPNGWLQDFGNACAVVPAPVQTPLSFVQIGAAGSITCGRTSDGAIWCWGSSQFYTGVGLGDSAVTLRSDTLIRVSSPVPFTTFAVGTTHSCASDRDGVGWCWGYNGSGALGRGALDSLNNFGPVPKPINSTAFIRRWALGASHTCALTGAGEALCWGAGRSGQRGDSTTGSSRNDPTYVRTALRFTRIAAGGDASCALESGTGKAWCWGENSSGQLGDGTSSDRLAPALVLGGLSFLNVVMRSNPGYGEPSYTCGASADGIYCWGLLPEPLTFGE